ncbi:type IV pilus modification protein PilV [Hahella aquimaris]|uniref:type IV pilus modification protein PilV n=1 Tax=Hahella sp. HNIBRBA332 TaxID=3015983 RepID=UPI00273B9CCF|nr:type IV pilus modification protein PilV [Hahella sp. HNIBRBA332]WLQ14056.1 type IV pilus modification protein PilV [Hahella sp. HNIBRBA332]
MQSLTVRNNMIGKRNSQRGFSMMEILVTLLITAIGLLGLASMQMLSLKNVNNSQFRTLATFYAYDMAERMRSNKKGLTTYQSITGSETKPSCSSSCSASDIAKLDAYEWNELIDNLPEGNGSVSKNGDKYEIKIEWSEQVKGGGGGSVEKQSLTLDVSI